MDAPPTAEAAAPIPVAVLLGTSPLAAHRPGLSDAAFACFILLAIVLKPGLVRVRLCGGAAFAGAPHFGVPSEGEIPRRGGRAHRSHALIVAELPFRSARLVDGGAAPYGEGRHLAARPAKLVPRA